jgi:hypothetical protein
MIHIVRIYQLAEKWSEDVKNKQFQDFEERGFASCTGLLLAARSCSLLKVDPQVLQRHPVMGVRAALASLIRVGLKDNPSSPPHCKQRRLAKGPLFLINSLNISDGGLKNPTLDAMPRVERQL